MGELLLELQSSIPLGEKCRKINEVSKTLSEAQVDKILEGLKKSRELDEVRLQIADKFQRSSEIIEILQNGDRSIIQKAVKLGWLYKVGPLTSADFLLQQLFPSIAFTTRQKVINNLGNHLSDTSLADEIFRAIEINYGFFIALPMLQACSEELIRSTFKARKVELAPSQILSILKSKLEVGLTYLRDHFPTHTDVDCCLNYLADHLPQELLQLLKDRPLSFGSYRTGNKRSKRIMKSFPSQSLELAQKDSDFFNMAQLKKRLSPEDYEKVFMASNNKRLGEAMRSSWERDSVWQFLDHLPKSRQLSILRNAYKSVYNKDLIDCPDLLPAEVVCLLNPEERAKLVEWKLANSDESLGYRFSKNYTSWYNNSKWFWTAFKPIPVAIPELTKLLNAEKDCSNRASLYSILILSCIVNNDSQQLIKVLQLLTKKSRNDQTDVRRELVEGMFHASEVFKFQQEHWACFEEVLQICYLYKEIRSISFVDELFHKHLSYLLSKNQPIQEKINVFMKAINQGHVCAFHVLMIKGPENQKKLIQAYITALENVMPSSTPLTLNIVSVVGGIAGEILTWNRINQKRLGKISISNYPSLLKRCEEIFSSDDTSHFICREKLFTLLKDDDKFDDSWLDKIIAGELIPSVLFFSLRKFPNKISSNIDSIFSTILEMEIARKFKLFFTFLRKLISRKDSNLIQKLRKACKSLLEHEDQESVLTEIKNAIKVLAIMESSEDFIALASQHYPVTVKMDASIPIDPVDYGKKQAIADSLKYLKNVRLATKAVDKFAAGDYLKLSLGSLYSVTKALPQEEAIAFLRVQLKEKPSVSVKKHMIRLFFLMSPLELKTSILKELWKGEKNPTIRFEILSQFYLLLRNHVTEQVWNELKSAIQSLSDEDTPSLEFLRNSETLDDSLEGFTSDFFATILEAFKRTKTDEYFELQLLNRIVNNMSKISNTFLASLLEDILSRAKSSNELTYASVVVKYLLDSEITEDDRNQRLELIGRIFKNLIQNQWDKKEINYQYGTTVRYCNKLLVKNTIRSVCSEVRQEKNKNIHKKVIEFFLELLESVQDIPKTFSGKFYLQLALIALEGEVASEELDNLRNLGKGLGTLIDNTVELYGPEILSLTNSLVDECWSNVWMGVNSTDHIVAIVEGLLSKESKSCLLTAIALRPDQRPSNEELGSIYDKITDILGKSTNLTVSIFYQARSSNEN